MRLAVYEPRTTDWCPSLIKTSTTRVVTGPEADRLRQGLLGTEDRRKMADIARSDLADSDDEDLSAFGKEIQKGLTSRESGDTVGRVMPVSNQTQSLKQSKPSGVMVMCSLCFMDV